MDDSFIFSKDEGSHIKALTTVVSRLQDNKLYVSPKKCEFMQTEIDFLGLVFGKNGVRVNPAKAQLSVNDLKVLKIDSGDKFTSYEEDELYGPLLKVMEGKNISGKIKDKKIKSFDWYVPSRWKKVIERRKAVYHSKSCSRHNECDS